MRIATVGGGPGGLLFSILAKKADPSREVVVFERNASDATFGFGVVLSDRTLENLKEADGESFDALTSVGAYWTDIEIRHRDRVLRCGGNGFSAISRKSLLSLLQARARDLGVELRFEREVADTASLEGYDLVVAADGINSRTRTARADRFGPAVEVGRAKYIWLGTKQPFDALTFVFAQNEHGCFGVHAYPSDGETSTFIVETDEDSWRHAGLDETGAMELAPGESDQRTKEYCEELFAEHLGGHGLLTNNSQWLNFRTLTNATWHAGNVVLLGDAAHTAHFSVGSGTKMALEDAIALARTVDRSGATRRALRDYEDVRRPTVERIQAASGPSQQWWERYRHHMGFEPEQFAYHFLTRNPRLTHDKLAVRDHRFVGAVESWFAEKQPHREEARGLRAAPLATPLLVRGVRFPNRIGIAPPLAPFEASEQPVQDWLTLVAGGALWGAGHVAVETHDLGAAEEKWCRLLGFVRERSRAKLSVLVDPELPASELDEAVRRIAEMGFDVLELPDTNGETGQTVFASDGSHLPLSGGEWQILSSLRAVRAIWPEERPVFIHARMPDGCEDLSELGGAALEFAHQLRLAGCDGVAIRVPDHLLPATDERRLAQLLASDGLRNEAGLVTLIDGAVPGDDEATTAMLSGRADLCRGFPSLASRSWDRRPAGLRSQAARPGLS